MMMRRYDSSHELPGRRLRATTVPTQEGLPRVQVLEDAVKKELASLNGQEELFLRATSDLSTLLRELSHEHGRSYFRYVLREVFGDKSKLYEHQTSHVDVIVYAHSIVKRMARAIHYAPLVLRACTQYVLREFQKSFPQCKSSEQIVVGSVLFLRILCPALVKPEVLGFKPHNANSLQTGVQIAKLLQNALRGTLCNSNQPESVASNEFISTFHPFISTFLARFPQHTTNVHDIQRPAHVTTRFASWDELDTIRSAPETPTSCGSNSDDAATRLRGMSMSTPEDMKQRKKKFTLRFW